MSLFVCLPANANNPALSWNNLSDDYSNFYSKKRMLRLGGAFALMSVVANTKADQNFQNWYQDNMRSNTTDDIAFGAKQFGEKRFAVPLSLGLSAYQHYDSDNSLAQFGANSARAYLVGTPAMLLMQKVTGGSRPDETHKYHKGNASSWRFLNDNNGVSGHAFMGAVPFLTLARMNKDNDAIRIPALIASTLTAWSRVNDDSHYLSQAILGWYMAYESVDAVFESNQMNSHGSVVTFAKPSAKHHIDMDTFDTQQHHVQQPTQPPLFSIGITNTW